MYLEVGTTHFIVDLISFGAWPYEYFYWNPRCSNDEWHIWWHDIIWLCHHHRGPYIDQSQYVYKLFICPFPLPYRYIRLDFITFFDMSWLPAVAMLNLLQPCLNSKCPLKTWKPEYCSCYFALRYEYWNVVSFIFVIPAIYIFHIW